MVTVSIPITLLDFTFLGSFLCNLHWYVVFVKKVCRSYLKWENTLLDASTTTRLKICHFGYSTVLCAINPVVWCLIACLCDAYSYIASLESWQQKGSILLWFLITNRSCDGYYIFNWFVVLFSSILQSSVHHSPLKSTVGTLACTALKFCWRKSMIQAMTHPLYALQCLLHTLPSGVVIDTCKFVVCPKKVC